MTGGARTRSSARQTRRTDPAYTTPAWLQGRLARRPAFEKASTRHTCSERRSCARLLRGVRVLHAVLPCLLHRKTRERRAQHPQLQPARNPPRDARPLRRGAGVRESGPVRCGWALRGLRGRGRLRGRRRCRTCAGQGCKKRDPRHAPKAMPPYAFGLTYRLGGTGVGGSEVSIFPRARLSTRQMITLRATHNVSVSAALCEKSHIFHFSKKIESILPIHNTWW